MQDIPIAQFVFYIASPIGTFLAVGIAYWAIYRQSKPLITMYYALNLNTASIIDLVICNIGGGVARDVEFSRPIPIHCNGIEKPQGVDKSKFLDVHISALAAGRELRFWGGQYGGLLSEVGEGIQVVAEYKYRTPLRNSKQGKDTSILDVRYMEKMDAKSSAAHDLSDALKGRNNSVFFKIDKNLASIDESLSKISAAISDRKNNSN